GPIVLELPLPEPPDLLGDVVPGPAFDVLYGLPQEPLHRSGVELGHKEPMATDQHRPTGQHLRQRRWRAHRQLEHLFARPIGWPGADLHQLKDVLWIERPAPIKIWKANRSYICTHPNNVSGSGRRIRRR